MPVISTCPKCDQAVTIPDGFDPDATVRCPLCAAEYLLGEALSAMPPALILVDTPAQGFKPDSEALLHSDLISEPYHVPGDKETLEPDEKLEAQQASDDGPLFDAWKTEDTSPEIELGSAAADETAAGDFGSVAAEEGSTREEQGRAFADDTRPRRKRKSKSALRQVVESVVGGFFGLLIGYYLLSWFGGDWVNLPELPLPFLPHTMNQAAETDAKAPDATPSNERRLLRRSRAETSAPDGSAGVEGRSSTSETDAGQPLRVETPLVAEPLPGKSLGPKDAPVFAPDELRETVLAAHDAVYGENATGEMTADAYRKFCRLGHVFTFVSDGKRVDALVPAVRRALELLAQDPARHNEIAQWATDLLDGEDTRQGGVLLVGTVRNLAEQKGLHAAWLDLPNGSTSVVVMSDRALPFKEKDGVLLLGSIISRPKENLVGYEGRAKRLVWLGSAKKIP